MWGSRRISSAGETIMGYKLKRPPKFLENGTIELFLTKGLVAVIDECDRDLSKINWFASYIRNRAYAAGIQYGKEIRIHTIITERKMGRKAKGGEEVDHIDGNSLNNRRENLRFSTRSENQANKSTYRNNKSGYKGVHLDTKAKKKKWIAQIHHKGEVIFLGRFQTPALAWEAYKNKAIELHGEFAKFE